MFFRLFKLFIAIVAVFATAWHAVLTSAVAAEPLLPTVGGVQFDSQLSGEIKSDKPQMASFRRESGKARTFAIEVRTADATGMIGGFTATELWCAYNLVEPSEELLRRYPELSAADNYRGLVTATAGLGNASFTLHPAVRGTPVGLSIARLDLLVAWMQRTPKAHNECWQKLKNDGISPIPWNTYTYSRLIWYDAELSIRVNKGQMVIEPTTEPKATILRVRFWQGGETGSNKTYDSHKRLAYIQRTFQPLQDVEHLCRCVAVLRWLKQNRCLPDLPTTVLPERIVVNDSVEIDDFMPNKPAESSKDHPSKPAHNTTP